MMTQHGPKVSQQWGSLRAHPAPGLGGGDRCEDVLTKEGVDPKARYRGMRERCYVAVFGHSIHDVNTQCCRDQDAGGKSERSGCPLSHLMCICSERHDRLDITSAAPASRKERPEDHRLVIFLTAPRQSECTVPRSCSKWRMSSPV